MNNCAKKAAWRFLLPVLVSLWVSCGATNSSATNSVPNLGRGLNILDEDQIWGDPTKERFEYDYYRMIKERGFQSVRINMHPFSRMDNANRLGPEWVATLDSVVKNATQAGLKVILDLHDYRPCGQDAVTCRTKVLAFWDQIAPRYRDAPETVLFEILNEPDRQLTSERWNKLLAETLQVIRRSNPSRTVVIGPAKSNSFKFLDELVLPEKDRNILVTIHYYSPLLFTHQGANWTTPSLEGKLGVEWGSPANYAELDDDFDVIAQWSKNNDRPILLGEFGALEGGAMKFRQSWVSAVARAAEARHFSWTYWQFQGNFAVFDLSRQKWVDQILSALIPRRAS